MRISYVVVTTIIGIFIFRYLDSMNSRIQEYDINDVSISKPMKTETISNKVLLAVGLLLPLTIMFILFRICKNLKGAKVENSVYFFLMLGVVINTIITELLKIVVGRLRPDFLERCMMTNLKEIQIQHLINDGRKSFPSAHSSLVFNTFLYLAGLFQIAPKYSVFGEFACSQKKAFRCLSIIVAFILAGLVGYTRILDNRHHFTDIAAGAFIGMFCGILSLFLLFKKLKTLY
ncbi:hypothetical protein EDEG_01321 [Edhazardia aedis USNM 41457]|uniref:Phosphatidic acid phosphatase type 2/haloperoxidase domain-containing protein n=1 Tax=Edhazardia aedis (strain USNM 41457) TaxID=1003232 RepID=J9D9K6_EDHAE|nr:hypothetical protein EDEG_01321 [Edhazardia aedis USNM 41457]|eukprot:EJW04451.1 hypothetical protein EDEG_01321 [Edhazardia aedis USNM 41457]